MTGRAAMPVAAMERRITALIGSYVELATGTIISLSWRRQRPKHMRVWAEGDQGFLPVAELSRRIDLGLLVFAPNAEERD